MSEDVLIPLHQNENYWLLTEEDASRYAAVSAEVYTRYPDYGPLRAALAAYAGTSAERVLATAGSDAAIRLLAEQDLRKGRRVLLPVPTFYGYEHIFAQVGLTFTPVCYTLEDGVFRFPVTETLSHIRSGEYDTVYLCQPNNPLGVLIPLDEMTRILDAAAEQKMLVVVDEAYFEFTRETALERVGSQSIVILRTLSKAFGLAGARVGYLIADTPTVASLQADMLPWPIAHASVQAALIGLSRSEYFQTRLAMVIDERTRFAKELAEISGITVYPSVTNFMLIRVPDADRVRDALEKMGVLVARAEGMSAVTEARELLKSTLRLSVPAPWHRKRVISALSEACA